jgi:hypothetical protein
MRKKKKLKEEQLELFAFVGDTMIIQDQLDLGITDKMKDVKPPADDDLFVSTRKY